MRPHVLLRGQNERRRQAREGEVGGGELASMDEPAITLGENVPNFPKHLFRLRIGLPCGLLAHVVAMPEGHLGDRPEEFVQLSLGGGL